MNLPPPSFDVRHRTVAEDRILEALRMHAFAADRPGADLARDRSACADAIGRWVARGLGHAADAQGRRLFDPAEVICFMTWVGVAGDDPFWRDHWVTTSQSFARDLGWRGVNRFSISLRRSFDLRRHEAGAPVRLRAPLPLPCAYHSEVEITPVIDAALGAAMRQAPGRLEARLAVPEERVVTFGADIRMVARDPTAATFTGPLAPEEAEIYLRPAEDLIRVTPRVRAVARRVTGDLGRRAAAVALWDYLMETLAIGAIRYDALAPARAVDGVLDGGWSDCRLAATCFVSLCRARGVPARLLGGHLLYPLAPTRHYWAEAWLEGEGWRPFDAVSWTLSEAGRDLAWRRRFAGAVEPRLVTECLPRWFLEPTSVRLSPAWQMLQTPLDPGAACLFTDVEDGSLIYRDEVRVVRRD